MRKNFLLVVFAIFTLALLLGSCSPVDAPEVEEADFEETAVAEDSELEVESETEVLEESDDSEEVEETIDTEEQESEEADTEENTELEENSDSEESAEQDETEETESETVEEESSSADHTIQFINDGFEPSELTISVGETVEFVNVRDGNFKQAMLIGTQGHTNIKSGMLESGESYSYTFTEADSYTFVDAILTTYVLKITVE